LLSELALCDHVDAPPNRRGRIRIVSLEFSVYFLWFLISKKGKWWRFVGVEKQSRQIAAGGSCSAVSAQRERFKKGAIAKRAIGTRPSEDVTWRKLVRSRGQPDVIRAKVNRRF
jgi:hypothetical protein